MEPACRGFIRIPGPLSGPGIFLFKQAIKEICSMKKDVIAYRKVCKADGTGLSHYILMNKETKAKESK